MSLSMLDANEPLDVPHADVLAWVDTDGPDAVWVLPSHPRIAMAQDGLPDVSLLLYSRGTSKTPDGGQLTLSVDLRLADDERAAAARAADALRPQPDGRDDPPLPPVQVRTPTWVDAAVRATISEGVTAEGKPSLLTDNSCLLTLQLDAAQATAVRDAWENGFPDGTVELTGGVDGVTSASVTGTVSSSTTTSSTTASSTPSSSTSYGTTSSTTTSSNPTSSGGPSQYSTGTGSGADGGTSTGTGSGADGGTSTGADSATGTTTGTTYGTSTSSRSITATVGASANQAVRVPLTLSGPLRLPSSAKTARRTDLNL